MTWLGAFGYLNDLSKGGVGSGVKGHTTLREKPNPVLMGLISNFSADDYYNEKVSEIDSENGTFVYDVDWDDWSNPDSTGKREPEKKHIKEKLRIEGRKIIKESDGTNVLISKKNLNRYAARKIWGKAFAGLFHNDNLRNQYDKIISTFDILKADMSFYDSYVPKLKDTDPETGKYAARMNLKDIVDRPHLFYSNVTLMWYSGNADSVSLVGEAAQEIISGNMDEKNVIQAPLFLLMEASRKTNKNHHTDFVYRGETNIEDAKALISSVVSTGEAEMADKLFSTSESEQLGKWYAAVHKQETARGTNSKSNVMLKIPYEKYKNNVALDYKATGSNDTPEREITIFGNGMKLTGDDIMIRATLPSKKNASWMTLSKFIKNEGNVQNFMSDMWEDKA